MAPANATTASFVISFTIQSPYPKELFRAAVQTKPLAYAIVDLFSAESYRLYKEGPHRIVFRPFRPVVNTVATIMSPAHRPLSNVARAFIAELKNEVYRMVDDWGQNLSPLSRTMKAGSA